MKITLKSLLMVAVGAFLLTACNKDSKSPEELLTGPSCWSYIKNETFNVATNQWQDDPLEDCEKDDCINFRDDDTVVFDEGATKCDPADPQSTTFSWSLSADGKTLTLSDPSSGTFTGTVVELSESRFVFELNILGFRSRQTFQAK
ncbi:MAG: lipocalin family protein [Saprospiraceae bacterium]|nr:lipocalin family protein [Saprospiraceae bacterium]